MYLLEGTKRRRRSLFLHHLPNSTELSKKTSVRVLVSAWTSARMIEDLTLRIPYTRPQCLPRANLALLQYGETITTCCPQVFSPMRMKPPPRSQNCGDKETFFYKGRYAGEGFLRVGRGSQPTDREAQHVNFVGRSTEDLSRAMHHTYSCVCTRGKTCQ